MVRGGGFEVSNGLKRFDVLGLVETFLQKDEAVSVAGHVWYGRNGEGSRRASAGLGMLMNRSLESRVNSVREGLVWVELRGVERRKLIRVVYVNPDGVSRRDDEAI